MRSLKPVRLPSSRLVGKHTPASVARLASHSNSSLGWGARSRSQTQPWTLALTASPVQVAAQNDRGAETADLIEIVVLDLTSWAHLLTARQPRCDHWGALPRAPWPYQLRDKKIPSPSRGANIHEAERSELTKRGAFSIPRSRQLPADGSSRAQPLVTSHG